MAKDNQETKETLPRRTLMLGAVQTGAVLSSATLLGTVVAQETEVAAEATDETAEPQESNDRKAIMAAGLTAEEADCWSKVAEAAGLFFALPELHPMDKTEVATAVHVIQNKLLGRPTYRKYLETHKAMAKDAKNDATTDTKSEK